MAGDRVLLETRGAVAIVTVNRPETMNALDMETLAVLDDRIAAIEQDDQVRVLVMTGAGGKAFVAGGDIRDLNSRQGLAHYRELAERLHSVFNRIERLEKPTIAAVNGWTLGGGMELLLCTDLRIVAVSARFGLPEINLGLFPGAGGSQRAVRQLALCKAKELMFLGDRITAADAERIGLVNKVVPDESLMTEAMAIAEALASKSPLVLRFLKRTIQDGLEMPPAAALRHEQAMVSLLFDSADAHEGCTAFIEKRPARFTGE